MKHVGGCVRHTECKSHGRVGHRIEGRTRGEKDKEPRREGQQGAERRGGKGGQKEAEIRESKSKRSKEGPRSRQLGSRAPGA